MEGKENMFRIKQPMFTRDGFTPMQAKHLTKNSNANLLVQNDNAAPRSKLLASKGQNTFMLSQRYWDTDKSKLNAAEKPETRFGTAGNPLRNRMMLRSSAKFDMKENNFSSGFTSENQNPSPRLVFGQRSSRKEEGIHKQYSQYENSSKEISTRPNFSNDVLSSSKKQPKSNNRGRMFNRPVDDEKIRAIVARVRDRLAKMEASEANTMKSPFVKKDKSTSSLIFKSDRDPDFYSAKMGNETSQECCRTLHFDNIQHSDESEDLTAPLGMMDMTSMITGASILRNSNLPCIDSQFGSMKKEKEKSQEVFKPIKGELESEFQDIEDDLLNRLNNKSLLSQKPTVVMSKRRSCVMLSENVPKKLTNQGRVLKRRSAIPSVVHTPKHKFPKDSKIHSLSKLSRMSENRSLSNSVFRVNKGSSAIKTKKYRRSVQREIPSSSACTSQPQIPAITVSPPHETIETESMKTQDCNVQRSELPEMCDAATSSAPEMCNAATNTEYTLISSKSPGKDLAKEVEQLLREQEEINRRASELGKRTLSRRQKMKESRVLESFVSSISPLRRLRSMVQEKPSYLNASPTCSSDPVNEDELVSDSVNFDDSDMDFCNVADNTVLEVFSTSHREDKSMMDCSDLNSPADKSCNSNSKWKHLKLNSRIFQTPSGLHKKVVQNESPVIQEDFKTKTEEELSPFTEMAGNCERPSLAPMTPHSHHQVSMIKQSLRKQLNQLYEL